LGTSIFAVAIDKEPAAVFLPPDDDKAGIQWTDRSVVRVVLSTVPFHFAGSNAHFLLFSFRDGHDPTDPLDAEDVVAGILFLCREQDSAPGDRIACFDRPRRDARDHIVRAVIRSLAFKERFAGLELFGKLAGDPLGSQGAPVVLEADAQIANHIVLDVL